MRSMLQKSPMVVTAHTDDVVRIWRTFVNGGLTSQFLTELLRLKDRSGTNGILEGVADGTSSASSSGKSQKFSSSVKRRPCGDFQNVVETGLRVLVEEPGSSLDMKEKILVSCLTAIKGVYFKSQAKTAVEDYILASSRVVNASHSLTELQKLTLTQAMTSLLSNQHPLSYLERILQNDSFLIRSDHDNTPPFPLGLSNSNSPSQSQAATNKSRPPRCVSPSQVEPSSSSNMKLVSLLTFKSYEVFPFLMKLKIEDSVWERYIQDLIDAGHRFSVLKAIQLNPDRVGLSEIQWLEQAMKENNDWEAFAELLGYIFHVRKAISEKLSYLAGVKIAPEHKISFSSTGSKRNAAGLTNPENYKNINLIKRVADSIILRDGREGPSILQPKNPDQRSLLTMPDSEFLSIMETFLADCIAIDSTLSLRAASVIVADFSGVCSLNEEKIKSLQVSRKLKQFVTKDKWLLAAQTAHSLAAKEALYRVLQEHGKYVEAKTFYEQFGLSANFPPVDEAKVQDQLRAIAQQYLMFPAEESKIVFVDSMETIMYMANIFGVSADGQYCESSSRKESKQFAIRSLTIEEVIEASKQSLLHFSTTQAQDYSIIAEEQQGKGVEVTSKSEIRNEDKLWLPSNPEGYRNIVGIDAEWRVEMYTNNSDEGAGILQLASPGHVFVIDLYKIGNVEKNNAEQSKVLNTTATVIRNIFADKKLLKLAFDFYLEDMKMIRNAGKGAFESAICDIESLLDIQGALRSSLTWFDLQNPYHSLNKKNAASLSEACSRYLGKPLLKSSQLSDWKRRPLTEAQLHYASLDAHCLIGILDVLLLEKGIDCGLQVATSQYKVSEWIAENSEIIQKLQSDKSHNYRKSRRMEIEEDTEVAEEES